MCAGYRFSPGHVIRTVVPNANSRWVWPSLDPMTTTLYTGGDQPSFIALSVLPSLGEATADFQMGPDRLWCRVNDRDPSVASIQLSSRDVMTPAGAPGGSWRVPEEFSRARSIPLPSTSNARSSRTTASYGRGAGRNRFTANSFEP